MMLESYIPDKIKSQIVSIKLSDFGFVISSIFIYLAQIVSIQINNRFNENVQTYRIVCGVQIWLYFHFIWFIIYEFW